MQQALSSPPTNSKIFEKRVSTDDFPSQNEQFAPEMDGKKMILSFWGMFCLVSGANLLEGRRWNQICYSWYQGTREGSWKWPFFVVRGDGADDGMSGVLKVSDVKNEMWYVYSPFT